MNEMLNRLWKQVRQKTGKWAETIKVTLQKVEGTEHITIRDLAVMILHHPETVRKPNEYLNLTFNDCYLKLNDFDIYLETKGKKHEQILTCRISQRGETLTHYQSFRAKDDIIALPSEMSFSLPPHS
ncbi:hypothetical protein GCM10008986_20070 [Salinibacillus aidingensis]|uniref:Uncharacterized protein n=1 Tax=Salinibacillus aidingensis TaxID=237684 RepID=A0ABN1BAC5_9BACI